MLNSAASEFFSPPKQPVPGVKGKCFWPHMLDVSRNGQCFKQYAIKEVASPRPLTLSTPPPNPLNCRELGSQSTGELWGVWSLARTFHWNPLVVIIFGLRSWTSVSAALVCLHSNWSALHSRDWKYLKTKKNKKSAIWKDKSDLSDKE